MYLIRSKGRNGVKGDKFLLPSLHPVIDVLNIEEAIVRTSQYWRDNSKANYEKVEQALIHLPEPALHYMDNTSGR